MESTRIAVVGLTVTIAEPLPNHQVLFRPQLDLYVLSTLSQTLAHLGSALSCDRTRVVRGRVPVGCAVVRICAVNMHRILFYMKRQQKSRDERDSLRRCSLSFSAAFDFEKWTKHT